MRVARSTRLIVTYLSLYINSIWWRNHFRGLSRAFHRSGVKRGHKRVSGISNRETSDRNNVKNDNIDVNYC